MVGESRTVCVWRAREVSALLRMAHCAMCGTNLVTRNIQQEYNDQYSRCGFMTAPDPAIVLSVVDQCPLCGWFQVEDCDSHGYLNTPTTERHISELRTLDLNSGELRIAELATYLRSRARDMYSLSPKRFEELICSVLKDHGLNAVHTGRSGDGGADIVIFSGDGEHRFGIVECKRYSEGSRIGVETLRSLVGAAVRWDVRRAYLVTTGGFTSGVVGGVGDYRLKGYEVELIDMTAILKLLGVYNELLPSLERIDSHLRAEIIEWNQAQWRAGD